MAIINEQLHIVLNGKQKSIKANLRVFTFKDGDYYISYSPSLDISGYGINQKESKKMFHISVKDFCENLLKLSDSNINSELKKFGWKKSKFFNKRFETATSYIDKEGILRNFNLAETSPIQEELLEV